MNTFSFRFRRIFSVSFTAHIKTQIFYSKAVLQQRPAYSCRFPFVLGRILFIIFLSVGCSSKMPSDSRIVELLFSSANQKNPDVLLKKVGNLDEDQELESFSLVRNGTEEVLGIFKKKKGNGFYSVNSPFPY